MYVCRLFNNIEFRANSFLYTIAQYIKTATMIKIRKEKIIQSRSFLHFKFIININIVLEGEKS
jgi:hypothetical protein